jgi:glycosidase
MERIETALQGIKPNVLLLGEEDDEQLAGAPYGLDYGWNLQYQLREVAQSGGGAQRLQNSWLNQSVGWPQGSMHMAVTQDWDMDEDMSMYGGTSQTMDAAVFNFTLNGVPEIFCGEEVANDRSGNNTHNPIDWHGPNASRFRSFYSSLIALRNRNPALQQGAVTWVTNSLPSQVITYGRMRHGAVFLVEINFAASAESGTLYAPPGKAWTDVSPIGSPGGRSHELPGTGDFSLQPHDFAIFRRS